MRGSGPRVSRCRIRAAPGVSRLASRGQCTKGVGPSCTLTFISWPTGVRVVRWGGGGLSCPLCSSLPAPYNLRVVNDLGEDRLRRLPQVNIAHVKKKKNHPVLEPEGAFSLCRQFLAQAVAVLTH